MIAHCDRLVRMPWPIACCASSGIKLFSWALAFSCSMYADWVRAKIVANSAQALEVLISTTRTASIRRIGRPRPEKARGVAPSTQRQNFRSAVTIRCW